MTAAQMLILLFMSAARQHNPWNDAEPFTDTCYLPSHNLLMRVSDITLSLVSAVVYRPDFTPALLQVFFLTAIKKRPERRFLGMTLITGPDSA
ncbi:MULTISPECIES: hypothetical protein [Tatumella]|uniref:Secreted protein n=1 Tax=Tatumella punctata TaxID=399969 RepID=A0ABW1VPU7_9GAMM|nr:MULTISPECIES: hypothetical protein [unclassified Tatumella]MBS0857179.1 hypothetical protein [Tatumella sp. JGM16]MBS0878546.1 hypothetical protein [Tatumella sp. JGM82]MBS0892138.1 hypothetical protein [Tatumella sp. JGM94]MBS0894008.1 hypothetical protein [Tatumella sp. JGM130]MBS0903237.1 hypothetical protein [Tatumella sp. JGM100]